MKHSLMIKSLLAGAALVAANTAMAAVAFNQDVNLPGPGVFFGSGNANGGWTVGTSNGIELGLRTHQRYPSPANTFNHIGSGTYAWADQLGYTASNRASWNYDFSINVAATGFGVDAFTYKLWIDSDAGAGHSWTVIDPSAIPDNATSGPQYEQNSENPRFAGVGIPGYVNTIAGTYDFVLQASDNTGVLASTYMRVNVNGGTASGAFDGNVPDSATTILLLGALLPVLAVFRRKS
jgi:hypothetical protein